MKATLKVVSLTSGQKASKDEKGKAIAIPTVHIRAVNQEQGITINIVNADPKLAEHLTLGGDFPIQFGK